MTPHQHTSWQVRVRLLLRAGYGVEDIAITTQTPTACIRSFVRCLRSCGSLQSIYGAITSAQLEIPHHE